LAYEPFIQALVVQVGQQDQVKETLGATIGLSSNLDVGTAATDSNGGTGGWQWITTDGTECEIIGVMNMAWKTQPDLGLAASIYNGFYNQSQGAPYTPMFTCRSRNCTWDPFASLAVCASCRDVSAHLVKATFQASYRASLHTSDTISGIQTSFTLPRWNLNLTNWDETTDINAVAKKRQATSSINSSVSDIPFNTIFSMSATGTSDGWNTLTFANSTTFLYGFAIINTDNTVKLNGTGWNVSHPTATECGLEMCTQIYHAAVVNGELQEDLVASFMHREENSLLPGLPVSENTSACTADWGRESNYSLSTDSLDTTSIGYRKSPLQLYIPDADARAYGLPSGTARFNVTQRTLDSTINWLQTSFSGQLYWSNNQPVLGGDMAGTAQPRLPDSFWRQNPIGSSLNDTAKLDGLFQNVATSMTVWIRNLGFASQPAAGVQWAWVPHIQVRWGFIALPLAVIAVGTLFCGAVMLETSRLGVEPWRDSCLATLTHGVSQKLRARLREAGATPAAAAARDGGVGGMKSEALKMQVALGDHPGEAGGVMLRDVPALDDYQQQQQTWGSENMPYDGQQVGSSSSLK